MFQLPVNDSLSIGSNPLRKVGPLLCYVEYPKGVFRSGKGWGGSSPADYGYINGYLGADHDEMDCYIGPNPSSPLVFVVDQSKVHNTLQFDEHKVMLGYSSQTEALADYIAGHNKSQWIFMRITQLQWPDFMRWLEHGDHSNPYKDVSIPRTASV